MMEDQPARPDPRPRLSVVISTLNAGQTLARCLDSLAAQVFRDFEVIVIDGGSKDDTAKISAGYGHVVTHFRSEPDTGIYDAWNKALRLSRGEWVSFLGADDRLATPQALSRFSSLANFPAVTLVSARVDMTGASGAVVRSSGEVWRLTTMKKYMAVAHPGAWHHRSLFDIYGNFDSGYRLAGDYEFLLRSTASIRAAFIPESLVTMQLGGISNRSYWLHVAENYSVLRKCPIGGRFHAMRFLLRASVSRILSRMRVAGNAAAH
jgi:glycosyltransferase involved in cell wall biosynthesis